MPLPKQVPAAQSDAPLLALLGVLRDRNYQFITPTPATHARVIARPGRRVARNLADILGWSVPFDPDLLDAVLLDLLGAADMIESAGTRLRARCRVSTLQGQYFLHSAYPTDDREAVFFGPDSYRFADFVREIFMTAPALALSISAPAPASGRSSPPPLARRQRSR